jgi:hypothetical protein
MVVRTLAFRIVRQVLGLIGLGPSVDAKDVEIAVLRHQLLVLRREVAYSTVSAAAPPTADRHNCVTRGADGEHAAVPNRAELLQTAWSYFERTALMR